MMVPSRESIPPSEDTTNDNNAHPTGMTNFIYQSTSRDKNGGISLGETRRNLFAFFIIGMCNNFAYVVMLSAAFDILKEQGFNHHNDDNHTTTNHNDVLNMTKFHCNPSGTGIILLADSLPGLLLKLAAPIYLHRVNYHIRFAVMLVCQTSSLLILAFSNSIFVSFVAVGLASICGALGGFTFLSLTSYYKRSTVSAWSCGTGVCGVISSFAYAGLLQMGLSKRTAVLTLLVVPCVYLIAIWVILNLPKELSLNIFKTNETEPTTFVNSSIVIEKEIITTPCNRKTQKDVSTDKPKQMSLKDKFRTIFGIRQYMIPLFLVFFAESTINQGLYEMLYYHVTWLTHAQQYRWFIVDYQIGVFVSRSSILCFHTKNMLSLSLTQCVLFVVLLLEVYFSFIPYIWITLMLVFIEGLIGGAVYVNTFYTMSEEVEEDIREFSLGATSALCVCGIAVASGVAIPLHTALCAYKKTQ